MFFHIWINFPHFISKFLVKFGFIRIHFFPFLEKILGKYINFFFIDFSIINDDRIYFWSSFFILFNNFNLIYLFPTFAKIIFCLPKYYNILGISFTNLLIFLEIYYALIEFFLFLCFIELDSSWYFNIFAFNGYFLQWLDLFREGFWSISNDSGFLLLLYNIALNFWDYLNLLFFKGVMLILIVLIKRFLLFYPKSFRMKIVIPCRI